MAHNITNGLYAANALKEMLLVAPTAGSTLNLLGNWWSRVTLSETGTYTLPDAPPGTTVLICVDDTSVITLADSSGTLGSFTGTSGTTAALCTATDDNSWSFRVESPFSAGAANVGVADSGGYTPYTTVEAVLASLLGRLQIKKTANATTTTVTAGAGHLTGAHHVIWQNNADGALTLTTRTAEEMAEDDPFMYAGYKYRLTIVNTGDNTVTLSAGSDVTLGAGTNTVATATTRDYLVEVVGVGGSAAITITTYGKGTIEAT